MDLSALSMRSSLMYEFLLGMAARIASSSGSISWLPCMLILLFTLTSIDSLLYLLRVANTRISIVNVATPAIIMIIKDVSVPSFFSPLTGAAIPSGFRAKFSGHVDGVDEGVCDASSKSSSTRTINTLLSSEFPVSMMLDTKSSLCSLHRKVIASTISLDEGESPVNSIVPLKRIWVPRVICLRFRIGSSSIIISPSVIEFCSLGVR
mmetsp:Transcript_38708/g.82615  ORF Transcript_38708/g.82615 Transcript_38708/m.82615 type:complete len:207 (-) Transcript_38708:682-1302(-)